MLSIRELRYYVAVAETLHFGRAADRLNVAQPALSRSIKSLEAKLGVTLFQRSSREVTLTPAGAELLDDARAVINEADRLVQRARAAGSRQEGTLNIAFIPLIEELAVELIEQFSFAYPAVVTNHRREYQRALIEAVRVGDLDGGLVLADSELGDEFVRTSFVSLPLVAYVAPSHPLATRERVSAREIAPFPLPDVMTSPGLLPRVLAPVFTELGVEPQWRPTPDPVARGPAVIVGSDEMVWLQTNETSRRADDMCVVMIDPPLLCPFDIVIHQRRTSALQELFLGFARTNAKRFARMTT